MVYRALQQQHVICVRIVFWGGAFIPNSISFGGVYVCSSCISIKRLSKDIYHIYVSKLTYSLCPRGDKTTNLISQKIGVFPRPVFLDPRSRESAPHNLTYSQCVVHSTICTHTPSLSPVHTASCVCMHSSPYLYPPTHSLTYSKWGLTSAVI